MEIKYINRNQLNLANKKTQDKKHLNINDNNIIIFPSKNNIYCKKIFKEKESKENIYYFQKEIILQKNKRQRI